MYIIIKNIVYADLLYSQQIQFLFQGFQLFLSLIYYFIVKYSF